ncbi:MAG: Tim44 domain-containing protein [Betaproteobacteria bacterium]|nr:Tim44 domain-containing protein [Betaproteobacteria bacterium]MSQ89194.1 Tim44 domain-containing protein [Betaproteobacteria bacterium]
MKKLVLGIMATLLCAVFVATEADAAKRLGGARSVGTQRSITNAPPAATPAKPAQAQQMQQSAAAQPAASGMSRWMPMLGGLALGGALGWLMGANGMGGMMVGILLAGLLAFAAIFVVRLLMRKREEAPQQMQYAGMGSETVAAPPPSQSAGFDAPAAAEPSGVAANVPAGFDVAGFLRGAKLNYMKLQIANDQGNLDELREFTSDALFEELKNDLLARGNEKQQTDVLALNADLLEVVTEGDKYWASVRFSGTVRESPGDAPTGFEEIWNLVKPVSGSQGWQLAGIQQMH